MKDFQQRVVDEKSELEGKLEKLQAFFSNDIFQNLPKDEQTRLANQERVMSEYVKILAERIQNFQ